ncbi:protein LURP-one-related 6-like [Phragmites australis]|uniref:protein LURP-one-related 6-like n=1 Tax=Phragmites australis TaxID=29695 RepID=UPI002D770D8D|nr:protein LURP-one-related 6-like [Phragmites australis]
MDNSIPVVSKIFCKGTPTMLMIRRRPIVVNGGGFVVTDLSQNVVFVVDGCGILGSKGKLMIKDGEGEPILFISRKGGIVQALSTRNKWNGYSMDYQGKDKLVFSLTDPKSCIAKSAPIRIHIEPKRHCKSWDFEIGGSFADRDCTIIDCTGKIVAQMGREEMIGGKDFYHVQVQSGHDQAFIIGVMAILDNIHGESTRC